MKPAIRYHRFSSKRQDKGSSLERQSRITGELCQRKGWQIVETLEDLGQSAWKGDHLSVGNLGKLRTRINAGLIERGTVIVVENLDRLSRQDYRTARRWIEDVTDEGLSVQVCNPELLLDSDAMNGGNIAAMLQHLLESNRASAESKRKSEFQKLNVERMREQARQGIVFNPNSARWLRGETGGTFAVVEERAAVIRMIYEWCASGLGLDSITQRLNATVKPWTPKGYKTGIAQWRRGYVRDILRSRIVEGEYHVGANTEVGRQTTGEIIRNYYPRVVDADLVARARTAMSARTNNGGRGYGEARNILNGLTACDKCGGSVGRYMCGNGRGARYAYFHCRNRKYGSCNNKFSVNAELFEAGLLEAILHLALNDTHFVVVENVAPTSARLSELRKQREVLEHDQAKLIAVLRRMSASDAILAELATIEAELTTTKTAIEDTSDALAKARGAVSADEHMNRVRELRASMVSEDQNARVEARQRIRQALSALVDEVRFHDTNAVTVRMSGGLVLLTIEDGQVIGKALGFSRAEKEEMVRTSSEISEAMIGFDNFQTARAAHRERLIKENAEMVAEGRMA